MVNITHKNNTLRKAVASAIVHVSDESTMDAIINKQVPKGDVFEFARAAGLLAVKKTSDVIPDCHPLPVEFTAIQYEILGMGIKILVEVHTIYKTGVEVEAMHGAAITALTMYDMLKPIDKGVQISNIQLEQKTGGKSDALLADVSIRAAVVVCSDSISKGEKQDTAGKAIIERLGKYSLAFEEYCVVPDTIADIQAKALWLGEQGFQLVVFCGGTGLSKRDVTPNAILPLLTQPIPGIMEVARNYGQNRMPYAMLSRGVAGMINDCLVLTVPGSKNGALETIDAIFPQVLHVFKVIDGYNHSV